MNWREKRWRSLGTQSIPARLTLDDAESVALLIGEDGPWMRAIVRYRRFAGRWSRLAARLPRHFEALAGYSDADIERLESLLSWMEGNPSSNLYPRQMPLAGVDTKWLETRISLVTDLVAALLGHEDCGLGFHGVCGFRESPKMIRIRLLDANLRASVAGLGDLAAPVDQLARLQLRVSKAYIVENIQTGLCFEDLPGAVVFLGLGYGVTLLERLPWLSGVECIYWGDIDTHGFAILNQARKSLGNVTSVLMDEATLLRNRALWVDEKTQSSVELPFLTEAEQAVYKGLRQQLWGINVRLEQERIPWAEAWQSFAGQGAG